MDRIQNTISLAKSSWSVLRKDRELTILPVLSFFASLAVVLVFFGLAAATGDLTPDEGEQVSPMLYLLAVIGSLAVAIISVFFQAALVAGAHTRLTGGDPTVGSSIGAARSKIHRIIPWALLNFTVGTILRAIRERAGFLGAIVGWLGETAWNLVTFLAVPVLMVEDQGPIDTVKRSASLFKRTWGENVAAQVGFGLLGIIAVIPAIIVGGLAASVGGLVAAVGIFVAVVYFAAVIVVMSALNGIFQTALYMYAAEGTIPADFSTADLPASFR